MTGATRRWTMPVTCAALVAFLMIAYEVITGVLSCDSGTVTNSVGFDEYRVSDGFGIRLYIQQLGPVPISFDFGFPILAQNGDQEQLISFDTQLPFN